jgi:hypothetical protein
MVWAMDMPSSFGEFFPGGEYPGFNERLHRHYEDHMSAEQKAVFGVRNPKASYVRFVCEKFRCPLAYKSGPDEPPVTPIESHEPPECFKTRKRYKSLGSLIQLNSQLLAVDEALKSIIEKLEPGKHQFYPIKIMVTNKEALSKPYFTMRISQYLDSFLPAKSLPEVLTSQVFETYSTPYRLVDDTEASINGIAVSKATIGNAHLWRERFINPEFLFLSDALQAEIAKAGLRVPKHFKVIEV